MYWAENQRQKRPDSRQNCLFNSIKQNDWRRLAAVELAAFGTRHGGRHPVPKT
jgi:hypothetical protein